MSLFTCKTVEPNFDGPPHKPLGEAHFRLEDVLAVETSNERDVACVSLCPRERAIDKPLYVYVDMSEKDRLLDAWETFSNPAAQVMRGSRLCQDRTLVNFGLEGK